MGYNHVLKMQGIAAGLGGRYPLRSGWNPRMPGARLGLLHPNLMPPGAMMGDPGLFGAIGKLVGGVAKSVFKGTPIGMAYNAVATAAHILRVGAPPSRSLSVVPPAPAQNFDLPTGGLGRPNIGPGNQIIYGGEPDVGQNDPPSVPAQNTTVVSTRGGGHALVPTSGNVCTMKGYHLNKSKYYVDSSAYLPGAHVVLPGTMCVKNRRMNPFNPRAASKAMHRLHALASGMKGLKKSITKLAREAGVHHAAPRHAFARSRK